MKQFFPAKQSEENVVNKAIRFQNADLTWFSASLRASPAAEMATFLRDIGALTLTISFIARFTSWAHFK